MHCMHGGLDKTLNALFVKSIEQWRGGSTAACLSTQFSTTIGSGIPHKCDNPYKITIA